MLLACVCRYWSVYDKGMERFHLAQIREMTL